MTLDELRRVVLVHKPGLKKIIRELGDTSVFSYFDSAWSAPTVVPEERKQEVLTVFESEASRLFGSSVAREATLQLEEQWYVSTAEHHAPVCHPFVVTGSVAQALVNRSRGCNNVIVFSCASISLNNSSFPRGIFWHTATLEEARAHVLPWKYRAGSVYGLFPYTLDDLERFTLECEALLPSTPSYALERVFASPAVMMQGSFADQLSLANYILWKQLPGEQSTNMLYIPQERMVADLIVSYHLETPTVIFELLFNPLWRDAFVRHFDGLVGSFTSLTQRGTYLFWGLYKTLRIPLIIKDGQLVSHDGTVAVALTPEAVGDALETGVLMPSMALSFIVLSFYYGLTCGGGFSQVDYLPELRDAWSALLAEMGRFDTVATSVRADFLSSDVACYIVGAKTEERTLATAIDLMLYSDEATARVMADTLREIPLSAALDNLMPEFYTIVQGDKPVLPAQPFESMTPIVYAS